MKFFKYISKLINLIFGCSCKKQHPNNNCVPNKKAYFIHVYKLRKSYGLNCNYIGLNVSADLTVEALQKAGYKAKSIGVIDDNKIDKIIFEERPSHLILKAFWTRTEKLELLAKKYPSCQFIVCCHSKPSFLAMENRGFEHLIDIVKLSWKYSNIELASNNKEMASVLKCVFDRKIDEFNPLKTEVLYLPNLIALERLKKPKIFYGDLLKVGIFCAVRPLKNIINQALAVICYCQRNNLELELHVLSDRVEMGGNVVLKNLRDIFSILDPNKFRLIEQKWMPHEMFLELVSKMDLGMQVSFTESFNIVAIDFLRCGIPVITSPAVEWSPKLWQANPDSLDSIINKVDFWLNADLEKREKLFNLGLKSLRKNNNDGLKIYCELSQSARKW